MNTLFCLLLLTTDSVFLDLAEQKIELPVVQTHWTLRVKKGKTPPWDKIISNGNVNRYTRYLEEVDIYIIPSDKLLDVVKTDKSRQSKIGEWSLESCYDFTKINEFKPGWFTGTVVCTIKKDIAGTELRKLAQRLDYRLERRGSVFFLIPKDLEALQTKRLEATLTEIKKIDDLIYVPDIPRTIGLR